MKRNASELRRLIFLKRKSIDDEEVRHLLEKARTTFRAFNPCPTYRARHFLQFAYWR